MKKAWIICFMAVLFISGQSHAFRSTQFERAIVKVFAVSSPPNYNLPWQSGAQSMATGSGVVIEGGRVLTNAHVVAYRTYVQVQRQGDPTKYPARVIVTGHECDLALLEVEDEKFLEGVSGIPIGKMPDLRDKVAAYGFPIGGDKLSITEGVVSRIEMGRYSHCWKTLPVVQIDAAINPGNSGGPIIMKNKIVGIAFQGLGGADNVGYMIPPPVIEHFLTDVEDGDYDGFPGLGISFRTLENPYHRKYLGMKDDQTGVAVAEIEYNSSAWEVLEESDVILKVEGQTLANDGTVPFLGEERIMFGWLLVDKFPGDKADMTILRDGAKKEVSVKLKGSEQIVSTCRYDVMPTYYVFGGIVFQPLSLNYLQSFGGQWWYASPIELKYHLVMDTATPEKTEVVIMQMVLADEVNVGYHDLEDLVVKKVNGQPITDLRDLIDTIEATEGEFVKIETEDKETVVLSKSAAAEANKRILERYMIPSDRSEDMK